MMKQATTTTRFAYGTGSRPLDGYTIKRGVGAGGFGEVYFAVSDAGKEVALKRIQRNLDVELRGVSQCLNLKHPNLVAIYDIRYDDEGQAWVVMEFVRGECLKDVIDRYPHGLPSGELLSWFRGIVHGVGCLHDHGIVHRDLKPGNIFLDEGVVKLGDYGLSKYISCSRRSGQTESVGTFHYMAPEIGRGVYGKEIDVYALGIILYELLSGRVPFDGESSHEIIMKHLTAMPDLEALPERMRPIVGRALFKDPNKRYSHVAEMLAAVETALGQTPSMRLPAANPATAPFQPFPGRSAEPVVFVAESPADGIYFGPVRQLQPSSPPAPIVAADEPEPIAAALRQSATQFVNWWKSPALNRNTRILLLIAFTVTFALNAGWIIPAGIVLGTLYLMYFGIRAVMLALRSPSPRPPHNVVPVPAPAAAAMTYPVAAPANGSAPAQKPNGFKLRRKWHEIAREHLRHKAPGERLGELTGSMLMSALVVGIMSCVSMIVAGIPLDGSTGSYVQFAWMALMSLMATWALLIPAKLWEGRDGDEVSRRFLSLVIGLAVGALGYLLTGFLGIRLLGPELIDAPPAWRPPNGMFAPDGMPQLPAFLAYFGGLFLLLRWWRQADPLRSGRFSFWSTAVTVGFAFFWQLFWPFPQPWSLVVPATMSVALQLSSTWLSNEERGRIRRFAEA